MAIRKRFSRSIPQALLHSQGTLAMLLASQLLITANAAPPPEIITAVRNAIASGRADMERRIAGLKPDALKGVHDTQRLATEHLSTVRKARL